VEDSKGLKNSTTEAGCRLYFGRLPRFKDQVDTNQKIIELFQGFHVKVVTKQNSLSNSFKGNSGKNYYCFVDIATEEEAKNAAAVLDGVEMWNRKITVQPSSGHSRKFNE
jgi:RNA recognition motif-containing protein